MSTASDRNLLFGILAWQNSLISQDQLLGAMKAWTFDKNRTLAEILVSHQVLEEDRASRLERMVDDQIALHNDDPKQSLGVLSSVATVAKSLAAIEDSQLQLSLAHLAKADVSSSEATLGSVGAGTSEGRFKILRPHAKGALGQVSIARDVELNRDVALKEIQTAQAFDPQSQSRFLLEAEITGGLEHPGIVPVYGLGNYEDGRPYYAMRFIRGQSLEQAIREYHDKPGSEADKNLEFRGLLKRFVDVCEAMSYAHSRGVLHRDLKPGNIMLGKYGETLVVDWGLAKALGGEEQAAQGDTVPTSFDPEEEGSLVPLSGSSVDQTMAGKAVGTPAYMSPEQAAGRMEDLGPATDVYAMGATLYHILTGQAPHGGEDLGEVIKDVVAGRFVKPRDTSRGVPRGLEAVCLKAMAISPSDRFGAVSELAEDIERFLADEPMVTFREPFMMRARRWVRKHQNLCILLIGALFLWTPTVLVLASQGLIEPRGPTAGELRARNEDEEREIACDGWLRKRTVEARSCDNRRDMAGFSGRLLNRDTVRCGPTTNSC